MFELLDIMGSVVVRLYPRTNASPGDLKTLGAALERWIEEGARQAGFSRVEHSTEHIAALKAGEPPLPEALWLSNLFREARDRGTSDPEVGEWISRLADLSVSDILRLKPDEAHRVVAFRVYGVGFAVKQLFDDLAKSLHAPALARVEFRWEVLSGFERI
jgi:hypothetical protein